MGRKGTYCKEEASRRWSRYHLKNSSVELYTLLDTSVRTIDVKNLSDVSRIKPQKEPIKLRLNDPKDPRRFRKSGEYTLYPNGDLKYRK